MSNVTDITVKFNDDKPFMHMMIIPGTVTCNDFIRRIHLCCPWRYMMVGSFPIFSIKNKTIYNKIVILNEYSGEIVIPKKSVVTIHKLNIKPFFFDKKFYDTVSQIKEKKEAEHINHIATWFNYNIHDQEPIIIYFIYKVDGKWNSLEKTSFSFDEVEREIQKGEFFTTLPIALERFYELKEHYYKTII